MAENTVTRIAESELILNDKGKIYHLNLAPEQLADTIITVGDPERVKEVSKHFDKIEEKAEHREFVTHTGLIGDKRLSVVSTGIGTDNIDIVMNELDALVNIDLNSRLIKSRQQSLKIIRMGTAGALQEDITVDDLVASTYGLGFDSLLHYYKFSNTTEELQLANSFRQHIGLAAAQALHPYVCEASSLLLNKLPDDYHKGITVTCPGFYGPQGRVLRGPLAFPNLVDDLSKFSVGHRRVVNFEMETAGIYGMGKVLDHQCLSISTIVANRISKTFSKDSGKAINNMIKKTLEIIVKEF